MMILTKDERELYDKVTSSPFLADDETSVVPGLVRIIDRLSARVEKLEKINKERRVDADNEIMRAGLTLNKLAEIDEEMRGQLTALLEAVEPIIKLQPLIDKNASAYSDFFLIATYRGEAITLGNLRNLASVVQKVKGESDEYKI